MEQEQQSTDIFWNQFASRERILNKAGKRLAPFILPLSALVQRGRFLLVLLIAAAVYLGVVYMSVYVALFIVIFSVFVLIIFMLVSPTATQSIKTLMKVGMWGTAPHDAALELAKERESHKKPLALVIRAFDNESPDRVSFFGWLRFAFTRSPPLELIASKTVQYVSVEYPMIAILNQERLSPRTLLDIPSLFMLDSEWQMVVARLIRHSSVIVVLLESQSKGLKWELAEISRQGLFEKVIVVVPEQKAKSSIATLPIKSGNLIQDFTLTNADAPEVLGVRLLALLNSKRYIEFIEHPYP
jgi:hypothetical protein